MQYAKLLCGQPTFCGAKLTLFFSIYKLCHDKNTKKAKTYGLGCLPQIYCLEFIAWKIAVSYVFY